MAFALRPANFGDAPILTDIYLAAFKDEPISRAIFPRMGPSSYNWWYDSILEEMGNPEWHFMCIYSTSDPKKSPVAYAKWNAPTSTPLPRRDELPEWPEFSNTELANHFFGSLFENRRVNMGERRHWYLELLATLPEMQGKGAASMLLKWGLEKADEAGLESYLEASPKGKSLYEKMGFEEKGRLVLPSPDDDAEEFVECFMLREPRTKS
ncbi:hypothetical protein HYFRA_00005127 [Hymenoscyphus fraxineus]|uniref:N-acetyltransferase domain-containing protein n=1 Tax=Hymenoscyphus fraxineus TaxID=746836 RepID=A0A9N9L9T4_9HELO|nr:hypothetical protein HYFRA_00005127 [Hymenoscyphus fraxineus]